jgi:hypothetical protein
MTVVGKGRWVEVAVDFEVEVEQPVRTIGASELPHVPPGKYRVETMRHWGVVLGDGELRGGDTWFQLRVGGSPVWIRSHDVPPSNP